MLKIWDIGWTILCHLNDTTGTEINAQGIAITQRLNLIYMYYFSGLCIHVDKCIYPFK